MFFSGILVWMTTGCTMQGVYPSAAGHSACYARRTVGAEGNVLAWKCGNSIEVPEDINNREWCCDNTSWSLPEQCQSKLGLVSRHG